MPNTTESRKEFWKKTVDDFTTSWTKNYAAALNEQLAGKTVERVEVRGLGVNIVTTDAKPEILNPPVHCSESRHSEEPDHLGFIGLDFPWGRKKVVDNDPEVR